MQLFFTLVLVCHALFVSSHPRYGTSSQVIGRRSLMRAADPQRRSLLLVKNDNNKDELKTDENNDNPTLAPTCLECDDYPYIHNDPSLMPSESPAPSQSAVPSSSFEPNEAALFGANVIDANDIIDTTSAVPSLEPSENTPSSTFISPSLSTIKPSMPSVSVNLAPESLGSALPSDAPSFSPSVSASPTFSNDKDTRSRPSSETFYTDSSGSPSSNVMLVSAIVVTGAILAA